MTTPYEAAKIAGMTDSEAKEYAVAVTHHEGRHDPFWAHIANQLELLCTATTVDEVFAICPPRMFDGEKCVGQGFFEGSGGDGTVYEQLREADWHVVDYRATYYWCLAEPDIGIATDHRVDELKHFSHYLTYIEGDLYRGYKMGDDS